MILVEGIHFNTAIAANMELLNDLSAFKVTDDTAYSIAQEGIEAIVLMLSPIVPHICSELWNCLGRDCLIEDEKWPEHDEQALVRDSIQMMIQVNGKLRDKITVAADADDEVVKTEAINSEKIRSRINDQPIKKIIVVKGRLVNIVV